MGKTARTHPVGADQRPAGTEALVCTDTETAPCILVLACNNHFTHVDRGAADRMLLGHQRPLYSEGRRTSPQEEPEQLPGPTEPASCKDGQYSQEMLMEQESRCICASRVGLTSAPQNDYEQGPLSPGCSARLHPGRRHPSQLRPDEFSRFRSLESIVRPSVSWMWVRHFDLNASRARILGRELRAQECEAVFPSRASRAFGGATDRRLQGHRVLPG